MISFVATIPSRQRGLRRNRARSPTIKTGSGWYPTQRHERRGPPAVLVQTWLDSSVLSPEQLAAHVRTELDSKGSWTDSCEVRYGGGPTARIDLVEIDGETWFRATGGSGLAVSADYPTLEDAPLDMVHLFAWLSWDVSEATETHSYRYR
jgi:hypothetical protein